MSKPCKEYRLKHSCHKLCSLLPFMFLDSNYCLKVTYPLDININLPLSLIFKKNAIIIGHHLF